MRMLCEKQQFLDSKYRTGLQQMLLSFMILVKTNPLTSFSFRYPSEAEETKLKKKDF